MTEDFYDIMTTELRKKTKKHYMFEEIEGDYKQRMIDIFNKAIQDEISSAAVYLKIAGLMDGFDSHEIVEKMISHGKEEFEHYTSLIDYASNHGILEYLDISLQDYARTYPDPNDIQGILDYKQELEIQAMNDYLNAAELAHQKGDTLTKLFFQHLAGDERRHYDDLQRFSKGNKNEF